MVCPAWKEERSDRKLIISSRRRMAAEIESISKQLDKNEGCEEYLARVYEEVDIDVGDPKFSKVIPIFICSKGSSDNES